MVSPSTSFVLLDTRNGPYTITMPPISTQVGRVLTFRDQFNNFSNNPPTLSTSGVDRFDTGNATQTLSLAGETYIVVGGSDYVWHMVSAQRSNQLTVDSLLSLKNINLYSQNNQQTYGSLAITEDKKLLWNGFLLSDTTNISSLVTAFISSCQVSTLTSSRISSNITRLDRYVAPSILQQQKIKF